MDDTLLCPICGHKFRNIKRSAEIIERVCPGTNHVIQLFTNTVKQQVTEIKLSLDHKYSKHLNINYEKQSTQIICMRNSKPFYIDLPEVLELDFPNLVKIKKKVDLYILVS